MNNFFYFHDKIREFGLMVKSGYEILLFAFIFLHFLLQNNVK
ncbi:MAG: hypothetical protein SO045_04735 [Campylobacter sp.]|nr:hypothetical protein [Campylobacter sp.]